MGDRVRLFARTYAAVTWGSGVLIGHNGSVLEVEQIETEGLQVCATRRARRAS